MTELLHSTQWMEAAAQDLRAAQRAAGWLPDGAAVVAFHAQQCAERAIKAVLVDRRAELPRTHSVAALLEAAGYAGVEIPAELAGASALTPYAVELRDATVDTVSAEEAREAVGLAERVYAWARAILG